MTDLYETFDDYECIFSSEYMTLEGWKINRNLQLTCELNQIILDVLQIVIIFLVCSLAVSQFSSV